MTFETTGSLLDHCFTWAAVTAEDCRVSINSTVSAGSGTVSGESGNGS